MIYYFIIIFLFSINSSNQNKLSNENSIKYIEFPFQRNLTLNETMEPEIIFKELFYNQIYINLKVGSNKKEIPFYIYLQQFPFVVQSSNVNDDQVVGLYNESSSKTYKMIKSEYFVMGDTTNVILSKDIFYFQNNNISEYNFYLCKENKYHTHITEGGKIGFKLNAPHFESEQSSFLKNLKDNNIISSYIFSLKYDINKMEEDTGQLIIGAYPHLYDKIHYRKDYYINDKAEKGNLDIDWIYNFDEVKLGKNIIETMKMAYFYFEIGFIIGTKIFFDNLKNLSSWKEYFENNSKCNETKFTIEDLENKEIQQKLRGDYIAYYCNKEVDIEKINIPDIYFVKKNMNFTFNISFRDMWIEKGNYKYFMIIKNKYFYNYIWLFGKPFFKKYNMVFDYDNKQIGLYTKLFEDFSENNDNKNYLLIISFMVIGGLVIIIIVLTFILIKCYLNLPRKKRANELKDDNYEYEENQDKEKNLIN